MSQKTNETAEKAARAKYLERTEMLAKIIRPLRTARYEADFEWSRLDRTFAGFEKDYGMVDLNPDFQRGHVWSKDQQRHYIENCLRGVVSTSGFLIQFNCPQWDGDFTGDLPPGFQCIDGLQRLTAVKAFMAGEVKPFGLTHQDLEGSSFHIRSGYRFRFGIHNFTSRADLLQHYLDLNAGGTPHSSEEIERVRGLLKVASC